MICPQCGYEMGNKSKCLRCGYEVKTLSVVTQKDENEQDARQQQEKPEVIDIDPCNVFLTHPYGYEDDFGTGFGSPFDDPFVSIIDSLFGDPIGDLLGGLFGFDMSPPRRHREEPLPPRKKKQGPIVVVDDIEIIEPDKEYEEKADMEEQKTDERTDGEQQKKKSESKIKNMFKRNNNRK